MAPAAPHTAVARLALLTLGAVALAGCSPRAAVVGAGGATLSAAGAVAGAAGSVASTAGGAVRGVAGGGGSGGSAGVQTADAAVQAPRPAIAPPPATTRALRTGIGDCLDALGTARVATALAADGWAVAAGAETTAAGAGAVGVARDGVRGRIVRGQRCSFAAEALTGPTSRAIALETLRDHAGAGVTPLAPEPRQAPCGGYAFDLDGRPARMEFTPAPGGDCTGAGAGVTVRLI